MIACVSIGCNPSSSPTLTSLFTEVQSPDSARLPIEPDDILQPVLLASRDSLLVCTNHLTQKALRVYNLNNGDHCDLVHIGKAENELLTASAIWFSDDALNVYGVNTGKILQIPAEQLFRPQPAMHAIPFPKGLFNLSASPTNDRYAAPNSLTQDPDAKQFTLLDERGQAITYFGNYPHTDSRIHPRESALIYQGKLAVSPSATKVIYASQFGSVFRFFDISQSGDIRLDREYRFCEPSYISDSDPSKQRYSVRWTEDCRAGALAIAPTESGCFILCEENKPVSDENWRIPTVYEFDWNGNALRKLCLGRNVQTIAYNKERRQLIALTVNDRNEYSFVAYRL